MILKIRLQRIGRKNRPYYRIIIISAKKSRNGKRIEKIGNYNPIYNINNIEIEKLKYWIKLGAQPTYKVKKIILKYKI